jgi:hypothetical protein
MVDMITNKDIDTLSKIFVTKEDLTEGLSSFKSELFEKIDPILKEVVASREERVIIDHKISDHEDRITVLEAKN